MKKIKKNFLIGILSIVALNSCKKEEIIFFNGSNSANFWIHDYNHSLFSATNAELPEDTVSFKVALSGRAVNYDRVVMAVVEEDAPGTPATSKRTTATPDQYKLLSGIIPADSLYGTYKFIVKNPVDFETGNLKVKLRMVESEHFKVGLSENSFVNLVWSRDWLQPETWRAMRFFYTAVYSTQVYKIIVEVSGKKELYYYDGGPERITETEAKVLGLKFADRVRELSALQGSPLLHDDGINAGLPIVPIY